MKMATKTDVKKSDFIEITPDSGDNDTAKDKEAANDTDVKNTNLDLYNKIRAVSAEAQKTISGGRLNGFTDINPMWRIKTLTEQFGMVGFGWYYDINRMWLEQGADDSISAFVEIDLYVKQKDEWSKPIKGVGGSSFVAKEHNGLYTSDECYKMALTDAISIACKSLGMGADIYFTKDRTKYDTTTGNNTNPDTEPTKPNINNNPVKKLTAKQISRLHAIRKSVDMDEETLKKIMMKHYSKSSSEDLTKVEYDFICSQLEAMQSKQQNTA